MPYQRESEKQAAQQQQQQPAPEQAAPEAAAPQQDLMQKQTMPGVFDPNKPGDPAQAVRMAQEQQRPGASMAMGEDQEASPEEQAEYERAVEALGKVLYEDDRTSAGIVKQLSPQEKVGSVAKASALVVQQLDMKFDFDEVIIPQLTEETVDRVIDLYENVHGEEFGEQEVQGALGATWEAVMQMYGIDEEGYADFTQGMSEEDFRGYEKQYKQFLGDA
jgi:hypothetical protein